MMYSRDKKGLNSTELRTSVSQTQLTAQESTLTSLKSERDELVEEKSTLEGKLAVMMSQAHGLQVRRREIIRV